MKGGGAFRGDGRRRRAASPALASLLLHGGAVLALAALHRPDPLPSAPQEQGVEVVWQDSQEDSAPGREADSSEEGAAESRAEETPSEPEQAEQAEQEAAEASPPQHPPEAVAPEPPPAEPVPPPDPALAEAPLPEEAEPPPPVLAEAPPPEEAEPLPAPSEPPPPQPFRAASPPEEPPPARLPLPPPSPPRAPPSPPSPPRQQAPSQAAAPRQALAAGPVVPSETLLGGSRASGAVSPPGLLDGVRNPEPDYPAANRQRGDQGVVTVLLRISENGEVIGVELVSGSGHPALDDSARRAVQRWRFRPATRDGVPVAGNIRTAIHFRLR